MGGLVSNDIPALHIFYNFNEILLDISLINLIIF
jgi:hypothetical protein